MTIDQFEQLATRQIQAYAAWYRKQQEVDTEIFPKDMSVEEHFDAMRFFAYRKSQQDRPSPHPLMDLEPRLRD